MTTIYDIAKKSGYSITTVSKVINNYPDVSQKTRKKILQTIEELDYHPSSNARSLMTKKYWTIGVVYIEELNNGIQHPFFSAVIESFRKEMEDAGYDLLLISKKIEQRKTSYIERFKQRGVDGVIVVSPIRLTNDVQEIVNHDIPSVFIDLYHSKVSTVNSDNVDGSIQVVKYLHSLGHRKIAHIAGGDQTFAGKAREQGFIQGMKELGLEVRNDYIENGGLFDVSGGYEAMKKLLALKDLPTAVYAAGDMMAIGAMRAIQEAGLRVPDDISIVGFDDIELAQYVTPSLTTIKQDAQTIGQQAADLLLKQIDNKKKIPLGVMVPVSLVERGSVIKLN